MGLNIIIGYSAAVSLPLRAIATARYSWGAKRFCLVMDHGIPLYVARRLISANNQGSSRPVVIETDAGYFLTKLRGAAQGTAALVAEMLVAAIAEALGLWVPSRVLIAIDETFESEVGEDELMDLLAASQGINLGFQYLRGARNICTDDIATIDDDFAAQVLWLDSFVMNVDRTAHNPNLMHWQKQLWVIDHGAALPFQYQWSKVVEDSPRTPNYAMERHLFWDKVHHLDLWDEALAAQVSASILQQAVSQIPACFLQPLCGPQVSAAKIERRRQAYAAYLWKRLKPPRPFMARWLAHQS